MSSIRRTFASAVLLAAPAVASEILVTSRFTDEVLAYDGTTGASLGVFASGGGLDNPVGLTFGPDGHLYVASGDSNEVLRYDGSDGSFLGVVVTGAPLNGPRQINFGPDGLLYVASGANDRVLAYDANSGVLVRVAAVGNGLDGPTSFTFGPDGQLYVVSVLTDEILKFDRRDGSFLGVFAQKNNLTPHDLSFGPDGDLYATSAATNVIGRRIHRFDGATGANLGFFVNDPALQFALGFVWDDDGNLLVANQGGDNVRRYDGVTGALIDVLVTVQQGGLNGPMFLTYRPNTMGPTVVPPTALAAGATAVFAAEGLSPGSRYQLFASRLPGVSAVPVCRGLFVGLDSPVVLGLGQSDEAGRLVVRRFVPYDLAGQDFWLEAVDRTTCETSGPSSLRVP